MTEPDVSVDKVDSVLAPTRRNMGGPQSPAALEICRGVTRLLAALNISCVAELGLPNGRRADVMGLCDDGSLWIVEIKSSIEDFRADSKWPDYRDYSDRLFFAVRPGFPTEILPEDAGLIIADRYAGEIIRPAPEFRLPAPRRKVMTLKYARAAAARLALTLDPSLAVNAALSAADI
jgi:hypothetical protein